jgi:hypothetical protein
MVFAQSNTEPESATRTWPLPSRYRLEPRLVGVSPGRSDCRRSTTSSGSPPSLHDSSSVASIAPGTSGSRKRARRRLLVVRSMAPRWQRNREPRPWRAPLCASMRAASSTCARTRKNDYAAFLEPLRNGFAAPTGIGVIMRTIPYHPKRSPALTGLAKGSGSPPRPCQLPGPPPSPQGPGGL